jgi:uncharacterized membrane protein YcaP (DUF421 family)
VESVWRGAAVYAFVWLVFRIAGKRSLASITTFDFVLLLIISETTQAALLDNDSSLINAFLVIVTLLGIDIALSHWKQWSHRAEKLIDGVPLVILADGIPLHERMAKERIDEGDILAAARHLRGLERLDQIKYAILERNGGITIVPREVEATDETRMKHG